MPQIHILPKSVYQLIAAGEVVERPASAIKEMVENSIDAGATRITVEIQHGGSTYMRITDDGCGIARADVPKVFISHATSKIATEEDLNAIGTLGFRGEAMASIGAVAQVELLTRTAEEQVGTRYVIAGGQEQSCDDAGCPVGTTVVVRDLFFNTPARMKFLKKDVTEGNAVAGVLDAVALSHPEIAFRLIRDGKQTLVTPGNKDLKSTVYSVFGRELTQSLIPVHYSYNGMELEGYVSSPHASRKSRAMQYFFINGRLVKSKTALAALEQAYKNSIMVGRFPACVLNITVNAALVDVNVHPAKIEVRFANEKPVFDLVYYGVKTAIETGDSVKEATFGGAPAADEVGRAYPPAGSRSAKIDFFRKKEESVQTVLQTAPRTDFWQTAQAGVPYRTAPQGQIPVQRAAEQSAAPTAQEPAPVKVTEINALEPQAEPVVQEPDPQKQPAQQPAEQTTESRVTLMALGDDLIHNCVYWSAQTPEGGYDFTSFFDDIRPIVRQYDLACINQETILVKDRELIESYPVFGSPIEVADALADTGFNVVTFASNHCFDKKETGITDTLSYFHETYPETGKGNLGIGSTIFAAVSYTHLTLPTT